MKARAVAETGLRALAAGNVSVIPGLLNNIIAFSNRLTPRSMQRATMKMVMGK
jgi:short-subunit dehydrogenase